MMGERGYSESVRSGMGNEGTRSIASNLGTISEMGNSRDGPARVPGVNPGQRDPAFDEGRKTIMVFGLQLLDVPEVYDLLRRVIPRYAALDCDVALEEILQIRRICQPDSRIRFEVDVSGRNAGRLFSEMKSARGRADWLVRLKLNTFVPRRRLVSLTDRRTDAGSLTVVSLNIGGIKEKRQQLNHFMSVCGADIICVQETLRRKDQWRLHMHGYHCMEVCAEPGPLTRGMLLMVREGIAAYPIGEKSPCSMFVRIFGQGLNKPMIIGNVYLPHQNLQNRVLYKTSLKEFRREVRKLQLKYPTDPMVLVGDFNRSREIVSRLVSRLGAMRLAPVEGDVMTYHKGDRTSDLDHVVVTEDHSHWVLRTHVDRSCDVGSDHWPVITEIAAYGRNPQAVATLKRQWDNKKLLAENASFAHHNYWSALELPDVDMGEQDRLIVDKLADAVTQKCMDIGSDLKLTKLKQMTTKGKAQPTNRTTKAHTKEINKQRALYRKWQSLLQQPERAEVAKGQYMAQRKFASEVGTRARMEHNAVRMREVEDLRYTPKDLWAWASDTAGWRHKNQIQGFQPMTDIAGTLQSSSIEVERVWKDHYETLASDVLGHSRDPEYWKTHIAPTINTEEVPSLAGLNDVLTLAELRSVLKSLSGNKAMGDDAIPIEVWKALGNASDREGVAPHGLEVLLILCRLVITSGIIPGKWASSTIVSILKKGDATLADNYRGISLMPTVLKIITTVMARRLSRALESSGKLSKCQAGFRAAEEGIGQVAALYEIARRRAINTQETYALFLDFKKAYDTVPHEALFRKLELVGIKGTTLEFIKGLYRDSTCAVRRCDGTPGETFPLLRGLRQGCPLSPILFTIFINDIFDDLAEGSGVSVPGLNTRVPGLLFADDTAVLADTPEILLTMYITVKEWAIRNDMSFGVDKCGLMKFLGYDGSEEQGMTEGLAAFADQPLFEYGGERIPIVSRYTYLGMILTSNLCMNAMFHGRIVKGTKAIAGMVPFLRSEMIPTSLKLMVLNGVVIPTFLYGSEIWGMGASRSDASIQSRVNVALRHIIGHRGPIGATPVGAMIMELGNKHICVLSAARRLRAYAKFSSLKSWISDLCRHPFRKQKRSWVTQTEHWINCQKLSRSVGKSSTDNGAGLRENIGEVTKELKLKLTAREVNNALKAYNNTTSLADYVESNYKSTKLIPFASPLGRGLLLMAKCRIGGYWNAQKLAKASAALPRYLHVCPFCNRNEGESISHIMVDCVCWAAIRNVWLGADIQLCRNTLDQSYNGHVPSAIIARLVLGGVLLKGTANEYSLPDWASGTRECLMVSADGVVFEPLYQMVGAWKATLSLMGLGHRVAAFLMIVDSERSRLWKELPGIDNSGTDDLASVSQGGDSYD